MNGIGETGFAEKERPEAGPDDAVVRPTKGPVCTSDVHTVHGAIGDRETLTLGYEVVGAVDEAFDLMESKDDGIIKPPIDFE